MNNLKIKYGVSKQVGIPDTITVSIRDVDDKAYAIIRDLINHYKKKSAKCICQELWNVRQRYFDECLIHKKKGRN